MTGVIADIHDGVAYLFADGMVTQDGYVHTHSFSKIRKLGENSWVAITGDLGALEEFIRMHESYAEEELLVKLKEARLDATLIIMTKEGFTTLDFSHDKETRIPENETVRYPFSACPLFFGSGTEPMSGAYEALDVKRAVTKGGYLKRIRSVFRAASKRVTSMGALYQTEALELN